MNFPKVAVVAVDTGKSVEMYTDIHRMAFLKDTEIHIVHVVQKLEFPVSLLSNFNYTLYEDEGPMRAAVLDKLHAMGPEILPYGHSGKTVYKCLFGEEIKRTFCDYLRDTEADLAIVSTRRKHGIFESSFSYHVGRHAPCSVIVAREKEDIHERS